MKHQQRMRDREPTIRKFIASFSCQLLISVATLRAWKTELVRCRDLDYIGCVITLHRNLD